MKDFLILFLFLKLNGVHNYEFELLSGSKVLNFPI